MVDLAIVIVLALFALAGYRRGLILEAGSILGFFVGLALAASVWLSLAPIVHRWLTNETLAAVVAFALPFVAGYLLVMALASFLRAAARLLMLSWLDRLAGLALGLLKGAFVVELALLFVTRMAVLPGGAGLARSRLVPLLLSRQPALFRLVFAPFSHLVPLLGGLR
ncbi:MAG: CvpA family protein [Chloroflexota bacterium]